MGVSPSDPRTTLERFFRSQLATGKAVSAHMKHASGSGSDLVHEVEIRPEPDGVNPVLLADEFVRAAEEDCAGLAEGTHSYRVNVKFEGGRVGPRKTFNVYHEQSDELSGFTRGSPKDIVAQHMKMTETMFRLTIGALGGVIEQQRMQNREQGDTIREFSGQGLQTMRLVQELLDGSAERNVRAYESLKKADRDDAIAEKLGVLAPAIVNRLGGKKLLPEKEDPRVLMIKGMLRQVPPEQMKMIIGVLGANALPLIEMLQEEIEDDKKKEETKRREGGAQETLERFLKEANVPVPSTTGAPSNGVPALGTGKKGDPS